MSKNILRRGLIGTVLFAVVALHQPAISQTVNNDPIALDSLEVSVEGVKLKLDFEPTIASYTVIIDDSVKELDFVAQAAAGATISINDVSVQGTTPVTIELSGAPINIVATDDSSSRTYTVNTAFVSCGELTADGSVDIDRDGDGLIEICDLEGLDAIRHQLDGSGYRASAGVFPITEGCPAAGCRGYELTRDLDFVDVQSYAGRTGAGWTAGGASADAKGNRGWTPISRIESGGETIFTGVFEGNGHTISNLYMVKAAQPNNSSSNGIGVGLFAGIGAATGSVNSAIRNIGLLDVDITANSSRNSDGGVGAIVGYALHSGDASTVTIVNSFATGQINANNSSRVGGLAGEINFGVQVDNSFSHVTIEIEATNDISHYGGLVGRNKGAISNAYASGNITGNLQIGFNIGRLVGSNINNQGSIRNAYAYGEIVLNATGRLDNVGDVNALGGNERTINSYYDSSITSLRSGSDQGGVGKTTGELQSPTAATGIYAEWNTDDWYFGSPTQYPILGYAKGADTADPACSSDPEAAIPEAMRGLKSPPCLSEVIAISDEGRRSELLLAALVGDFQPTVLNDLTVFTEGGLLDIDFDPTIASYTVIIDDSAKVLRFVPEAAEGVTISINDMSVPNATLATIELSGKPISIVVTAADSIIDSKTYTINTAFVSCGEFMVDGAVDIDRDGDGLIEICDLEGLDAIRHQLDGTGYRASADATAAITQGCPASGCRGFELTRDLDFSDAQSYADTANMAGWTKAGATADDKGNSGWTPISRIEVNNEGVYSETLFSGVFDGNGYKVSNLYMVKGNQPTDASNGLGVGLFAGVGAATGVVNSAIRNIGLLNIDVTANAYVEPITPIDTNDLIHYGVGGIVGHTLHPGNMSTVTIVNSFTTGQIKAVNRQRVGGLAGVIDQFSEVNNSFSHVTLDLKVGGRLAAYGGLVGATYGALNNVYASGDINGAARFEIGRLVGDKKNTGSISNAYAYGTIDAKLHFSAINNIGGINGQGGNSRVTNSYYDTTTDATPPRGFTGGEGKSTAELQSPTTNDGIYAAWSTDDWYFGGATDYPLLGYAKGADTEDPACSPISDDMSGLQPPPCLSEVIAQSESLEIERRNELLSAALFGFASFEEPPTEEPAALDDVVVSAGDVELDLDFGSTTYIYTVIIDDSVEELDFAIKAPVGVTLSIDSDDIETTAALTSVEIAVDHDPIRITVTAADNSNSGTYTFNIGRVSCGVMVDGTVNIDKDDDGLIEICDLEGLDAIRHQLDGSGYRASADVVPITKGCPASGCKGFELTRDLDFSDAQSYAADAVKAQWTRAGSTADAKGNRGWTPISRIESGSEVLFTGIFDGNGYKVSNLYMVKGNQPRNASNGLGVGLFAGVGASTGSISSVIRNIGLLDIAITVNAGGLTNTGVGGVVGYTRHPGGNASAVTIVNSFTTGRIKAVDRGNVGGLAGVVNQFSEVNNSFSHVTININAGPVIANYGGLVGVTHGALNDVYASGDINSKGSFNIGRLVGRKGSSGSISNAYAYGKINAPRGGNIGGVNGNGGNTGVTNSYYDTTTDDTLRGSAIGGEGQTTEALQMPTTNDGIYAAWSTDDWYFGGFTDYPLLGYGQGSDTMDLACSSDLKFLDSLPDDIQSIHPPLCLSEVLDEQSNLDEERRSELLSAALFGFADFGEPPTEGPVVLDDLAVFAGDEELELDFASTTYTYTVIIDDSVAELDFVAQATAGVTISINDIGVQSGTPVTIELSGEPINVVAAAADGSSSRTYTVNTAFVSCGVMVDGTVDIDRDDDGLIEICDLEGLDAIRHQLDGTGYKASADVTDAITDGCPASGCRGYELTRDLDFSDAQSYAAGTIKAQWTTTTEATTDANGNSGWMPISRIEVNNGIYSETLFTGIFEGNGHTIANLYMVKANQPGNTSNGLGVGLFAGIGEVIAGRGGEAVQNRTEFTNSSIRNLGLLDIDITSNQMQNLTSANGVGGIAGYTLHSGTTSDTVAIVNSFTTGQIKSNGRDYVGGLVGFTFSDTEVFNSFADVVVTADGDFVSNIGGLIGANQGILVNVYAGGNINIAVSSGALNVGGLLGVNGATGMVDNAYSYGEITTVKTTAFAFFSEVGGLSGTNQGNIRAGYWDSTVNPDRTSGGGEGQTTEALKSPTTNDGIYAAWSTDDWYFGGATDYPILGYGTDGDVDNPACSSDLDALDSLPDDMQGLQPPPCLSEVIAQSGSLEIERRNELLSKALFGFASFEEPETIININIKVLLEGLLRQ